MFKFRRTFEDKVVKIADDLPAGVYQVDNDGRFLYCNKIARDIFGIPDGDTALEQYNITDYYADPNEAKRLQYRIRKAGGYLLNETIPLEVNGQEIVVLESRRCLFDSNGNVAGCLGILSDATGPTAYHRMLADVPVGIYEVDEDEKVIRANKSAASILGFKSVNELIDTTLNELYIKDEDLIRCRQELEKKGRLDNQVIEMRRQDGQEISVQVTSKAIVKNQKLIGRFGAFTDVTKRERYFQALEKLPAGYYRVEKQRAREIITQCNKAFANMHGYKSPQDLIEKVDIRDLYADKKNWERFTSKLTEAVKQEKALEDFRILAKRKDGTTFWISDNARVLCDRHENIIGREGTARDITKQVELENKIRALQRNLKETTQDMDLFMHRYVAPMMRIDASLQVQEKILRASRPNFAESDPNVGLSEKWADRLEKSLASARKAAAEAKPRNEWLVGMLERTYNMLTRRTYIASEAMLNVLVRETAVQVLTLLGSSRARSDGDTIQELKHIKALSNKIVDDALLYATNRQRSETAALNTVIESLRHYLFRKDVVEYEFQSQALETLIAEVIETYAPLAAGKRLSFQYRTEGDLTAEVADTHVKRMISNLLLNAIKYSYRREDGYIDVKASETATGVCIEVSNYGVPIKEEEIRRGKIFEYGYRGELSKDHNRTGSGVGLADVKMTVDMHTGTVEVDSFPASGKTESPDYSVPFLTIVRVFLPKLHTLSREEGSYES